MLFGNFLCITLQFLGLPVFLKAGSETNTGLSVFTNQSVLLSCNEVGNTVNAQDVQWKHFTFNRSRKLAFLPKKQDSLEPSKKVFNEKRTTIYNNGSLEIQSIQLSDAGNYTCTVTDRDGNEDTLTFVLNVQDEETGSGTTNQTHGTSGTENNSSISSLRNNSTFWNDSQIAIITVAPVVVLIISAAILIKMKYWKNNGELREENIYTNMNTRPGRSQAKNNPDSIYENMGRIARKTS
ncbi:uncharacterized protein LOC121327541 [Polyodon spathula]|uniref:uncharacterized protein LOC121327541 n=1 Tax=Polyodon spathula TaxID=7913 RepID=UPI001B7F5B77|nr:uncharacterized protein LOC121327541 [Polyodon spathula]